MQAKRILVGIISAAMVFGTMAVSAFAEEEPILTATVNELPESVDQIVSFNEDAQTVAICNGINFSSLEEAVTYAKNNRERENLYQPRDVILLGDTADLSQFSEFPVNYVMNSENIVITGEREWKKYPSRTTERWYEDNRLNIDVSADVKTITLQNAKGLGTLEIAAGADVTLKLDGANEVLAYISIGDGTKLTIEDVSADGTASLVVYNTKGKGSKLNAFGIGSGYNAAIGSTSSYYSKKTNEIVINSGTIEAYSTYGAAIGGGQENTTVTVTINGGKVKAVSNYGAAIGGGQKSNATVVIKGGKVEAEAGYAAAIGGGEQGSANVTITAGEVVAVSGSGAAIGGGSEGNLEFITISGGDITASISTSASAMGAAIGSGSKAAAKNILITGDANVTVLPGKYAPISGSSDRKTGYLGAAIGAGSYKWGGVAQDTQLAENITIDTTGKVTVAEANVAFGSTTQNVTIKTGSYQNDVSDFLANGYYLVKDAQSGAYTIAKSKATVIDNATAGGVKVTLDNLDKHEAIDKETEAKYEVVVDSVQKADKSAIEQIKEEAGDEKTVVSYDISVQVTKDGKTTKADITAQKVTIDLPTKVADGSDIKVYHIVNGVKTEIAGVELSADRMSVSFIAPSFSAYSFVYTAQALSTDDVTKEIAIEFVKVTDTEYDIVAKAADGKKINGLMTADLTFALTQGDGHIEYSITPAANMAITPAGADRYEFNFDGINEHEATGTSITIGRVTFEGYGENAKFAVAAAGTNILHTTKTVDAIVEEYTASGDGTNTGKLVVDNGVIDPITITVPTKKLTINITFPNAVASNAATYQQMKVTIVGGETNEEIDLDDMTDGAYKIEKDLPENTPYTVTVAGSGYRTARYTVTLNGDKVLNFWNNVKDNAVEVEEGVAASAKNVTFLAGDIVKDNNINIYDLSAVVSYFGTNNLVAEHPEYAKYDLNRDGKIDSKDVAYVLVSWGK